jgi:hypothetical protein
MPRKPRRVLDKQFPRQVYLSINLYRAQGQQEFLVSRGLPSASDGRCAVYELRFTGTKTTKARVTFTPDRRT